MRPLFFFHIFQSLVIEKTEENIKKVPAAFLLSLLKRIERYKHFIRQTFLELISFFVVSDCDIQDLSFELLPIFASQIDTLQQRAHKTKKEPTPIQNCA